MFGMSWGEILIIVTVGMFVLGPERIPVAVKWVGSTLKTVRTMAAGAQEQLRGEFGPEIEELRRQVADLQSLKEIQDLRKLRDLNPRTMLQKNLFGEEFSGGIGGFLGLNDQSDVKSTGSGVAPEVEISTPANINEPANSSEPAQPAVPTWVAPESVQKQAGHQEPAQPQPHPAPVAFPAVDLDKVDPGNVDLNKGGPEQAAESARRATAGHSFDVDAT